MEMLQRDMDGHDFDKQNNYTMEWIEALLLGLWSLLYWVWEALAGWCM